MEGISNVKPARGLLVRLTILLRLGLIVSVLFTLFGCGVPLALNSDVKSNQQSTQASKQDFVGSKQTFNKPTLSSKKTLLAKSRKHIGLELVAYDEFEQVLVKANNKSKAYKVHRLSQPDRLVIDLDKSAHRLSSTISTRSSESFNKIRFGAHKDKSRLVFDMKSGSSPLVHRVDQDLDGNLSITFARAENAKLAQNFVKTRQAKLELNGADRARPRIDVTKPKLKKEAPLEKPQLIAVKDSTTDITDSNSTDSKELVAELEQQLLDPVPVKLEKPGPALIGLDIQTIGPAKNKVVAKMEAAGFYTFSKTAPTEYVLTLEDASLAKEFKPLIAPRGAGSIRSVRAVKSGDNVLVRVFSEPGVLLQVQARGTTLAIEETKDASKFDKDAIMAQAAVEDDEAEVDEVLEDFAADGDIPSEDELTDFFAVDQKYSGRLISLDLQDTEIDNALRIIAEVSNLNIIASDDVTGKVTLRLIDVPWDQALDVILKTNGLDKVQEGNVVRIAPVEKLRAEREALKQAQQAEEELEPLRVQYIRISYAKAAELQPLVETVITERGTVAYDERSNQLIVKDISKGLKNVARLVQKLDLRTPQVLIETQIVEAQRSFVRELGSELGFFFLRTPETGNPTGYNFPNSIEIGGSAIDVGSDGAPGVPPNVSFFPASNAASAVSMLFGSADGTKGLDFRLSQAENEGRVRVVSRPSVAVTNNSPAVIKSVEKLRIKLPSGGVSVATGQGASSAGGGSVATEVIEIGIVLNVTAQASPDYYVLLDLDAKSSTLGPIGDSVDNIPPEIERSATSSVLVSSGQTFAMGGIYRITEDNSNQGVPFLKDVPVLGHFFRRAQVNDLDEELIFFITPRIIEGSFDDAAMKAVS